MIAILVLLFRLFLRRPLLEAARRQAERGLRGSMEGHAAMDMSVTEGGNIVQRALSPRGFAAILHYFVMDWAAIWRDVAGGLLIAGALGAWVPVEFWRAFFLSGDPRVAALWGPVVGPLVSMASFVCSIGNVPLAAVLWNGGISFGGGVSFIFAGLLIFSLLHIYRKYYGRRLYGVLFLPSFAALGAGRVLVEL